MNADDGRGGPRVDRERLDAVEQGQIARPHVLLQRTQDRRRAPQDIDALQGGDCEERQDCGRENEQGTVDALELVIYDDS